ncbi:hypothetical protein PInf_007175 [Phytophthora infestans]|nr:hypothetical protein PInf_007175 [Phytophthora infestans]
MPVHIKSKWDRSTRIQAEVGQRISGSAADPSFGGWIRSRRLRRRSAPVVVIVLVLFIINWYLLLKYMKATKDNEMDSSTAKPKAE